MEGGDTLPLSSVQFLIKSTCGGGGVCVCVCKGGGERGDSLIDNLGQQSAVKH